MSGVTSPLHGQQVLVLGLGESGLAMARWCARQGAHVAVWDSRSSPPQLGALREQVPAAEVRSGALDAQALHGVQLLLKSPGLGPQRPAGRRGAGRPRARPRCRWPASWSCSCRHLAQLRAERDYAPQVLAVTGTNGKTTTTALTALLVERAGRSVVAAGNIGPTMLDTLMRVLDEDTLPQVWVLELSSFQLDTVRGFEPHAAAVLNLTQDHLDWHGDMAAYAAAKARIFGQRTVAVINRDDPLVEAMVAAPAGRTDDQGQGESGQADSPHGGALRARRTRRAGRLRPRRTKAAWRGWCARCRSKPTSTSAARTTTPAEVHLQRLMPADALRLRGRHNAANALAALALATAIGCPLAPMLHGLREYGGEAHRVQPAGRVGEVEAFDDSKGTNVGATVAALLGLGADKAPAKLVVILGGDGKGQDFAPLAEPVARHARAVALIGRDARRDRAGDCPHRRARCSTTPICRRPCAGASSRRSAGDAVLLSPACASLDMFRNYGHRAEVFVRAVHELAAEHGEVQT